MQKLIDTVSSFYATGIEPQARMFRVGFGQYQDRVILIYSQTSNRLVYVWADPPYVNWSDPEEIAADSADYPCSAHMDPEGNIYVVYSQQTSLALLQLKMTFSQGSWDKGEIHTVCNVGQSYFPSILKDPVERLWICWTYYDSATERYFVNSKTSQDDGITWGTGPSDPGTGLTNGTGSCFSQLLYQSPYIHCFFSDNSTLLAYRSHHLQSTGWITQQNIYSGSQIDFRFCADLSTDNRVGIVFPGNSALLYKEYDGSSWSGVFTVDTSLPQSVAVRFLDEIPYLFFTKEMGDGQNQLFYSYKESSSFVSPLVFESGQSTFDGFLCYDDSASGKYADKTSQAADSTLADVFHPTSGALVKDTNDTFYVGMRARFNQIRIILSIIGVGGQVIWQYWSGEEWTDLIPQSGSYNLDSEEKTILLWDDLNSVPLDWQMCPVNGASRFWVRCLVVTPFATAPLGSQITALSQADSLKVII